MMGLVDLLLGKSSTAPILNSEERFGGRTVHKLKKGVLYVSVNPEEIDEFRARYLPPAHLMPPEGVSVSFPTLGSPPLNLQGVRHIEPIPSPDGTYFMRAPKLTSAEKALNMARWYLQSYLK